MSNGANSQNQVASNSYATAFDGGSSSPAPTHTSAGGRSYRRGRENKSRAGDFACSAYNSVTGEVYELPAETVKAVDGFPVPAGFRREGTREASFMDSIGVYVKTTDEKTAPSADNPKGVPYLLNSIRYKDKYQIKEY